MIIYYTCSQKNSQYFMVIFLEFLGVSWWWFITVSTVWCWKVCDELSLNIFWLDDSNYFKLGSRVEQHVRKSWLKFKIVIVTRTSDTVTSDVNKCRQFWKYQKKVLTSWKSVGFLQFLNNMKELLNTLQIRGHPSSYDC